MAQDRNGNNHKAAGRPDGGQFDRKAGQGSDDDLDLDMLTSSPRLKPGDSLHRPDSKGTSDRR
jgi:hypothetical protein